MDYQTASLLVCTWQPHTYLWGETWAPSLSVRWASGLVSDRPLTPLRMPPWLLRTSQGPVMPHQVGSKPEGGREKNSFIILLAFWYHTSKVCRQWKRCGVSNSLQSLNITPHQVFNAPPTPIFEYHTTSSVQRAPHTITTVCIEHTIQCSHACNVLMTVAMWHHHWQPWAGVEFQYTNKQAALLERDSRKLVR